MNYWGFVLLFTLSICSACEKEDSPSPAELIVNNADDRWILYQSLVGVSSLVRTFDASNSPEYFVFRGDGTFLKVVDVDGCVVQSEVGSYEAEIGERQLYNLSFAQEPGAERCEGLFGYPTTLEWVNGKLQSVSESVEEPYLQYIRVKL